MFKIPNLCSGISENTFQKLSINIDWKCSLEHLFEGKGEILIWTNLTSEWNLVEKSKNM